MLVAPSAAALDALPSASEMGASEARVLVRLPEGGLLRVRAEGALDAALATPGGAPTEFQPLPAEFTVVAGARDSSWHGLPGTVEVHVRRDVPAPAMDIALDDGAGGVVFEWPAAEGPTSAKTRWPVPAAGVALAIAAIAAAVAFRRRT